MILIRGSFMKTLMVYNSKGGSGKSTICTNLASYYAQSGMDVTIIDLDPQQSSIQWPLNRWLLRIKINYCDIHTRLCIIRCQISTDGRFSRTALRIIYHKSFHKWPPYKNHNKLQCCLLEYYKLSSTLTGAWSDVLGSFLHHDLCRVSLSIIKLYNWQRNST